MVFVILAILKYIAYAVLFVIAFAVLLTVVVLACPLKYKLSGHNASAVFAARWLFGFVKFSFDSRNGKPKMKFSVFGMKQMGKPKKAKVKKTKPKPKKELTQKQIKKKVKKDVKKEKRVSKKNKKPEKEKFNIQKAIKTVVDYPEKGLIIKKTLLLVKRLLKPFKPSNVNVVGEVGFDSPDVTGKFLAAESVVVAFSHLPIAIKGNFERECVSIKYRAKGSFCLFSFVVPVVQYVCAKQVREIIFEVI